MNFGGSAFPGIGIQSALPLRASEERTRMLNPLAPSTSLGASRQTPAGEAGGGLDLSNIIGFVRRQWPIIAAALAVALCVASSYLLVTQPLYVGKANLLLDTRKLQLFENQSVLSDMNYGENSSAVESQIEILKSESIAASVVDELHLMKDPEFTGNVKSFF